jgi:hypothetical protein
VIAPGEVVRTGKGYFKASGGLRTALLTSSALALAWALPAAPAHAASDGTWLTSPGSNDYGTGSNWDGNFVPAGTASFGTSATTSLVISSASVGDWTFNAGASNYTFDVSGPLNFTGAGIIVNGGSATIYNNNQLVFLVQAPPVTPPSPTTPSSASQTPPRPVTRPSSISTCYHLRVQARPVQRQSPTTSVPPSPAPALLAMPRSPIAPLAY